MRMPFAGHAMAFKPSIYCAFSFTHFFISRWPPKRYLTRQPLFFRYDPSIRFMLQNRFIWFTMAICMVYGEHFQVIVKQPVFVFFICPCAGKRGEGKNLNGIDVRMDCIIDNFFVCIRAVLAIDHEHAVYAETRICTRSFQERLL